MAKNWTSRSVLPGFGLTMGYTLVYLSLIVLVPLSALLVNTAKLSWVELWNTVSDPRAVASFRLTFGASLVAALTNLVFGFVVAWSLVRYHFPGRRFLDALIDLPFALPTAVSGITLATIYGNNGWLTKYLSRLNIETANSNLGITIALVFIGLPFVVRTLQPALEELDPQLEEAAASLGAKRWQTFLRVIVPSLVPAMLTGFALAFARAIGEYGSVIFIASNKQYEGEIASLLIISKLEEHAYPQASAIAVVMLLASFVVLLTINLIQWQASRRLHGG